MFTVLNSESLWIGTDLKRFNEIRDILDSQNIKYKYKVKDQLGEWAGSGTQRRGPRVQCYDKSRFRL